MRHTLLFFALFSAYSGATTPTFEEFKKQQLAKQTTFKNDHQLEYQAFRQAYLEEYDKFRDRLLQNWSRPVQSSLLERVEYSADKKTRIIIDEQNSTVTVQTLEGSNETGLKATSQEEALTTNQLLNNVKLSPVLTDIFKDPSLLDKAVKTAKVDIKAQPDKHESEVALINEITSQHEQSLSSLDKNEQLPKAQIDIQKEQLTKEKEQRISNLNNALKKTKEQNLTYKRIKSHTFALPDTYLQKKVAPFVTYYSQFSKDQLSLLLAISHAESSFDPNAKSHIPAFGLMQIVPNSAGLDVARRQFKKDIAPTAKELFDPKTNITYGAGYLDILTTRYLRKINNPISRRYCAIAAYNTGAGNVAKAFNLNRSTNINKAVALINQLDSEGVYAQLIDNLPYDETKKYLQKVSKLDIQYQKNLEQWNLNNKEVNHAK
ncbi:transglycosylase SLT domain-containing protein [Pseudoalteromonas sp. SG43-7]|uniref:transglycosylase SLT domain-containing protein n=1 Tax=unclassified Pseudoalteromonas TaxID=194690 RepID=UPI001602FC68|nr:MULTISPECIES: transglycosylase SLT domain-containing protein [unclassified Pseudoalteromonas]MBB1331892.1 transglycosylase SLT domain-containing protein [Pseudoalteromonas sp. SR41-6]MBB1340879.1 transglycosylase SLT domain-containing protein [Pseudoalteromonas sp. SR45-6]MBB1420484.1 transglycosylase SLT domain-containing protein [Pseudoalteromonas sp. SG43-7]MBB1458323.1 transglycosylase SLT domain-containing protein [Pseudoalteromonas sp. SG41-8]MBB1480286.1 transglycosylase SLT domain-c